MAARPESGDQTEPGPGKDFWDKVRAAGPALVALAVGVMGTWFNLQQAELDTRARNLQAELERQSREIQAELERQASRRQVFTELLAQRERADSDLRATMFQTLFQAYFAGNVAAAPSSGDEPAGEAGTSAEAGRSDDLGPDLATMRRQIMFLDLLARNFDTIDIKPLYEGLDEILTRRIFDTESGLSAEERSQHFRERLRLRGQARSLAGRQTTALANLRGTKSDSVLVRQESCDRPPELIRFEHNTDAEILADLRVADGRVRVTLDTRPAGTAEPTGEVVSTPSTTFFVSHYDMPFIDNSRLYKDNRVRVAVVLERFLSSAYTPFQAWIRDTSAWEEFQESILARGWCTLAKLRLIQFPAEYMGLRDRPFLEQIINDILKDGAAAGE